MQEVRKKSKLSEADLKMHEKGFAQASDAYLDRCVQERTHGWATCMLKLESLTGVKDCE
tara:strand:- start:1455 stop:1631 length:177 start_codon:yes stop_codon:yes gene_type:complete